MAQIEVSREQNAPNGSCRWARNEMDTDRNASAGAGSNGALISTSTFTVQENAARTTAAISTAANPPPAPARPPIENGVDRKPCDAGDAAGVGSGTFRCSEDEKENETESHRRALPAGEPIGIPQDSGEKEGQGPRLGFSEERGPRDRRGKPKAEISASFSRKREANERVGTPSVIRNQTEKISLRLVCPASPVPFDYRGNRTTATRKTEATEARAGGPVLPSEGHGATKSRTCKSNGGLQQRWRRTSGNWMQVFAQVFILLMLFMPTEALALADGPQTARDALLGGGLGQGQTPGRINAPGKDTDHETSGLDIGPSCQEQLACLEGKNKNLTHRVELLQDEIASVTSAAKGAIKRLHGLIGRLKHKSKILKGKKDHLQRKDDGLQPEIDDLQREIDHFRHLVEEIAASRKQGARTKKRRKKRVDSVHERALVVYESLLPSPSSRTPHLSSTHLTGRPKLPPLHAMIAKQMLDLRRRLSGTPGTCADQTKTYFQAWTESDLKNAVACGNNNPNRTHVIDLKEHIQMTGTWDGYSAIFIEENVQLEINGAKVGSQLVEIRGQGQSGDYGILDIKSGANVTFSNLDLRDGYVSCGFVPHDGFLLKPAFMQFHGSQQCF